MFGFGSTSYIFIYILVISINCVMKPLQNMDISNKFVIYLFPILDRFQVYYNCKKSIGLNTSMCSFVYVFSRVN